MASNINPAFPASGNATTASVRQNFTAAKEEIETLQTEVAEKSGGLTATTVWDAGGATNITSVAGTAITGGLKTAIYLLKTVAGSQVACFVGTDGSGAGCSDGGFSVAANQMISYIGQYYAGVFTVKKRTINLAAGTFSQTDEAISKIWQHR